VPGGGAADDVPRGAVLLFGEGGGGEFALELAVGEGAERLVLARVAARFFATVQLPGALPVLGAAAVLIGAAVVASLVPAARAARVDVLQALRSE